MKIKINKSKFTIEIIILFLALVASKVNASDFDYKGYLQNRFNFVITPQFKIVFKLKSDFKYNIFSKYIKSNDTTKAFEIFNSLWPSNLDKFIDSAYNISEIKPSTFDGSFIVFRGDSTYYTFGYFNNGEKDSLWTTHNRNGTIKKYYNNENMIIITEEYDQLGRICIKNKERNGAPIDTSYWWVHFTDSTGYLKEKTIWINSDSSITECYDEIGKKVECEEY